MIKYGEDSKFLVKTLQSLNRLEAKRIFSNNIARNILPVLLGVLVSSVIVVSIYIV